MDKIFDWLAPFDCVVCGAEGELVCAWCEPDLIQPLPSRCYDCNRLSPNCRVCQNCRRRTPLTRLWIGGDYQGALQLLIQKFKYARAQAAAEVLAAQLDITLPFLRPNTLVSYVPTAPARVRQRGYDQAAMLAGCLAGRRGLVCRSLLRRQGQTQQVGATRSQRLLQLEGAFWVPAGQLVKGATILLVDDVLTTGATMATAAGVLKQAGAKQVNGVVIARKR